MLHRVTCVEGEVKARKGGNNSEPRAEPANNIGRKNALRLITTQLHVQCEVLVLLRIVSESRLDLQDFSGEAE